MKLYTQAVESQNFHNTWVNLLKNVLQHGPSLVIGDASERKPIMDSCAVVSLYGRAIWQIEQRELHPQFPFKRVEEYCNEFTQEYVEQYRSEVKESGFSYIYMDRLLHWSPIETKHYLPPVNQLADLRMSLKTQIRENITSNRNQAITWVPHLDPYIHSPCLQRVQIRYIPKNQVDVHLTWRSRDLYAAWQPNVICVVDMLNREVIKPCECKITRLVDYSDSLHIYQTDVPEARKIKRVITNPQEIE